MSDDDYHMIDQFLRRNLDDTEYDAYIAALDRVAALAARAEPVAKVRVHRTGGNAGIAWSAVAVTDGESLPLMPDGAKLYAAPPALREAEVEAGIAAMDDVYSHPAQQRAAITEQDREAMRAALRAAAAARGR